MPKQTRNPKTEVRVVLGGGFSRFFSVWDEEAPEALMLKDEEAGQKPLPADLMERSSQFGEAVVRFVKKVPRGADHPENNRLVDQLIGASTSIGANYSEADDAVSSKDFRNKIGLSRKESKEAMFFLRMVAASEPTLAAEARTFWREAKELNLIFGAIWRKTA